MRFPCRKSRQHSHIVTLPPPPSPPHFAHCRVQTCGMSPERLTQALSAASTLPRLAGKFRTCTGWQQLSRVGMALPATVVPIEFRAVKTMERMPRPESRLTATEQHCSCKAARLQARAASPRL